MHLIILYSFWCSHVPFHTCSPHRAPRHVPKETDYEKIIIETNSGTTVSARTTSLTWRH